MISLNRSAELIEYSKFSCQIIISNNIKITVVILTKIRKAQVVFWQINLTDNVGFNCLAKCCYGYVCDMVLNVQLRRWLLAYYILQCNLLFIFGVREEA